MNRKLENKIIIRIANVQFHLPTNSASNEFDKRCFLDDNSLIPSVYLNGAGIFSENEIEINEINEMIANLLFLFVFYYL